jgi:hypothetical protein
MIPKDDDAPDLDLTVGTFVYTVDEENDEDDDALRRPKRRPRDRRRVFPVRGPRR